MTTEEEAMKRPLGVRQIETLEGFSPVGDNRWQGFIPTRSGEPWPLMKSLMRRGLMCVKKERACYWGVDDKWTNEARYNYYASVTFDGERALDALADEQ